MHSSTSNLTHVLSLRHYRDRELIRAHAFFQAPELLQFLAFSRSYTLFFFATDFPALRHLCAHSLRYFRASVVSLFCAFALPRFSASALPRFLHSFLDISTSRTSKFPTLQQLNILRFYAWDTPRCPSSQHDLCGPCALPHSLRHTHPLSSDSVRALVRASRPLALFRHHNCARSPRVAPATALHHKAHAFHASRPLTISPRILFTSRTCTCPSCALYVSRLCAFLTSLAHVRSSLLATVRALYASYPWGLFMR